ncbi:MAG: putative metal-binding motif-containing protein, partial [Myxococcota bacterium]
MLPACGKPAEPGPERRLAGLACDTIWYVDDDDDGYGANPRFACVPPPNAIRFGGDCDDTRADVNPGADEVCDGDGVDEDCDGLVNDEDRERAGWTAQFEDVDGDGYGGIGADYDEVCVPQPGFATEGGDCDDEDPAFHPGAPEVCGDGIDHDCGGRDCVDMSLEDATAVFRASDPDDYLWVARGGGDIDGDGRTDVLVTSPDAQYFGAPLGAVYLYTSPLEGELTEGDATAVIRGVDYDSAFAFSADFLTDVNGDGLADVVLTNEWEE